MTTAVATPTGLPAVEVHTRAPRPDRRAVTVRRRVRPRPAIDLSRLTRYRGGTYSHTVETIVFTDGTSARTDLIRLNPGVEAYSLDFAGVSPSRPSHYRVETFSEVPNLRARAFEVEVDWILRNSFPSLRVSELSRQVRAGGYPLGAGNISEHEAIAATQAAIWHLTNGLELDTRPRNEPTRLLRDADGITVEFDGSPELGGYTVEVSASTPVTVTLHKSVEGTDWQEVAASQVTAGSGSQSYRKALGVGATVASSRYGQTAQGHRFYRLTVEGGDATIGEVGFWLAGTATYRNAERIVHAYNYLLDGARRARARSAAPALGASGARIHDGRVGPFRLRASSTAALSSDTAELVTEDGSPIIGPVEAGSVFYLRPRRHAVPAQSATVTMTVPGAPDRNGGRVLTGVARDDASMRLTPVALVVPVNWVVDFEIDW